MSNQELERRAFTRLPTDISVQVLRPQYFVEPLFGKLEEISQSGAILVVPDQVPLQEWLKFIPVCCYSQEDIAVNAIVEKLLNEDRSLFRYGCRFPAPLEYGVFRNFI